MISVDEALSRCLALATPVETETVALRHACGRVMAVPATARLTQPPFAASAMDGYALGAAAALGAQFTVIGEAGAGHGFAGKIAPDQALRIFTGAPLPEGGLTIAIQEDVSRDGPKIILNKPVGLGENIRPRGQDFALGDTLSPRLLRANDLALLAAMNVSHLQLRRRPVVALIASGDELVMPGDEPAPDQIIASNTFALAAMIEAVGGEARMLPIARDNEASLRAVFNLARDCDLIVTIGGASVGDHDLVGKVASDLGLDRAFWKIAMRPGKPLMAGRVLGRAMLGLPGNPVSAIVCGHLFLIPMLKAMLGLTDTSPRVLTATLGRDLSENGPRTHYMRARLSLQNGVQVVTPFERQDSALLTILTQADALVIVPPGSGPQAAGAQVSFIPL